MIRAAVSFGGAALLLSFVAVLAYALVRPGCSLFPTEPPAEDHARAGSLAQACEVLGEPVPLPRDLPPGYRRYAVTMSAAHDIGGADGPPMIAQGHVSVSFGRDRPRMVLTYRKWSGGYTPTPTRQLGPYAVWTTDRELSGGRHRSYAFVRGALFVTAHIALEGDVTGEVADRAIASIP